MLLVAARLVVFALGLAALLLATACGIVVRHELALGRWGYGVAAACTGLWLAGVAAFAAVLADEMDGFAAETAADDRARPSTDRATPTPDGRPAGEDS